MYGIGRPSRKPGSVIEWSSISNSSCLKSPATYPRTERATPHILLLGLAPDGVYQADKSPCRWCALTAPFHPYRKMRRFVFCGTFLKVTLTGR